MAWTCPRGADACPSRLERSTTATPANSSALRRGLRTWLLVCIPDHDLVEDMVLAVGEALDNTVDHAFLDASPGAVRLAVRCRPDVLTVSVTDEGRWRTPRTGPTHRGRGVDMIRALTDASFSSTAEGGGTVVTMVRHR